LNYLVLIGRIDLVPQLFGGLSVPTVVRDAGRRFRR
jgi:hypothetical protein